MHFTLVFRGHESFDLSYGLLFIPCPVWVRGERKILNLHPENPQYQPGDFGRLLHAEKKALEMIDGKHVAVVVHGSGVGSERDFAALQDDLRQEGFTFQLLQMDRQ